MAMELEFWVADGPKGEAMDFAVRVQAWQILYTVERYWRPDHVMVTLRRTDARQDEWIIKVRQGYTEGTKPAVGKVIRA